MLILEKDYSWEETESFVYINVPQCERWQGVESKVESLCFYYI